MGRLLLPFERYTFSFFLLVLTAITCFQGVASAVEVNSSLEPSSATVGDPLELRITISGIESDQIVWPHASGSLGEFFVLDADTVSEAESGDFGGPTIQYTVAAFDTGLIRVDDIYALVSGDSIRIPPFSATIHSVLTDSTDTEFRTFKAQEDLPVTFVDVFLWLWPWLLGAVVLAAAWFLIMRWIRSRKHPFANLEDEEPPLPPYEEAIEALQQLRFDDPLKQGDTKEFVSRLSEIVKRLLERVHDDPVLEMTTYEVKKWISQEKKFRSKESEFIRLLNEGDMVKFAKGILHPDDCRGHLNKVERIVEAYKPDPAIEEKEDLSSSTNEGSVTGSEIPVGSAVDENTGGGTK